MSLAQFPPKNTAETKNLVFDFISQLAIGETISSASCASSVWTGTASAAANIISGSSSISGTKVTQAVAGGTNGTIYNITCTIVTSAGQTLTMMGLLAVITNPI